eukprot:tig00021168_g19118.t1
MPVMLDSALSNAAKTAVLIADALNHRDNRAEQQQGIHRGTDHQSEGETNANQRAESYEAMDGELSGALSCEETDAAALPACDAVELDFEAVLEASECEAAEWQDL